MNKLHIPLTRKTPSWIARCTNSAAAAAYQGAVWHSICTCSHAALVETNSDTGDTAQVFLRKWDA